MSDPGWITSQPVAGNVSQSYKDYWGRGKRRQEAKSRKIRFERGSSEDASTSPPAGGVQADTLAQGQLHVTAEGAPGFAVTVTMDGRYGALALPARCSASQRGGCQGTLLQQDGSSAGCISSAAGEARGTCHTRDRKEARLTAATESCDHYKTGQEQTARSPAGLNGATLVPLMGCVDLHHLGICPLLPSQCILSGGSARDGGGRTTSGFQQSVCFQASLAVGLPEAGCQT